MYDILELKKKKLENLQEIAGELEISEIKNYKKLDLIYQILDKQATSPNNKNEKVIKPLPKINKSKKQRVIKKDNNSSTTSSKDHKSSKDYDKQKKEHSKMH